MTIGKRIKAGRIARGLSQEDIAKEMFLTRQTISKLKMIKVFQIFIISFSYQIYWK